uniref:Uncharacterized protein n=1 Tax=Amphimedon queenslandica TaxID=400682 RepID=A0A1X7SER0_AMPQE
ASQAQFISCPISLSPAGQPFCMHDRASYQCRVDSADTLEWRVYNATEYLLGSSMYGPGASVGTIKSFGIDFTTNLTSTGSPIISDIAFRVKPYMINYTLECRALRSINNDTLATDTCPFVIG